MKRNVVVSVLLMYFTCGIYYLYLIYQLSKEINEITNDESNNPLLDLVLTFVTCGLYAIYWFYKTSTQVEVYARDLGLPINSIALLNTILAVFPSGGMIAMAILQTEVNKIIDEKYYY